MSSSPPASLKKRTSVFRRFSSSRSKTVVEPDANEKPLAVLRIQVIGCKELPAADMNGKSDPYVVVNFTRQRQKTPAIQKTLAPEYDPKTATFDFPIYASMIERIGSLVEIVVWDKDVIGKDYLGELSLPSSDWFKQDCDKDFASAENKSFWLPLVSTRAMGRARRESRGHIHLKLGLVDPPNARGTDFERVYAEYLDSRRGNSRDILSAPPTDSVGGINDGSSVRSFDEDGSGSGSPERSSQSPTKLPSFRINWAGTKINYSFSDHRDIHGVVMLEVKSASNLPKVSGAVSKLIGGSWDMDPFVFVAFGRTARRTRVVRHNTEPEWNEKFMFHVSESDIADGTIHLSVLDWDKLFTNDVVGDATISLKQLMDRVPPADPNTGLYPIDQDMAHEMKDMVIPLTLTQGTKSDGSVKPSLYVRVKFESHECIRQRFWRSNLMAFDKDNTGKLSRTELNTFLSEMGLSLNQRTLDSFWTGRKRGFNEELTVDEAIVSLEYAIGQKLQRGERPPWEDQEFVVVTPPHPPSEPIPEPAVVEQTPAPPAPVTTPKPEHPIVQPTPAPREPPVSIPTPVSPELPTKPELPAAQPTSVPPAPPMPQPTTLPVNPTPVPREPPAVQPTHALPEHPIVQTTPAPLPPSVITPPPAPPAVKPAPEPPAVKPPPPPPAVKPASPPPAVKPPPPPSPAVRPRSPPPAVKPPPPPPVVKPPPQPPAVKPAPPPPAVKPTPPPPVVKPAPVLPEPPVSKPTPAPPVTKPRTPADESTPMPPGGPYTDDAAPAKTPQPEPGLVTGPFWVFALFVVFVLSYQ